jgi:hypothetical protein
MTTPLPAKGSTDWYPWAQHVHNTITDPEGVFTPQAYGATADGTTDDTAAIQDAIDTAIAAGGGTVLFGPGTYRIAATLTLGEDLTLTGAGAHMLEAAPGFTDPMFQWLLGDGITERHAPHFLGLRATGRRIIRLNDPAGGFTAEDTQEYMMRAVIDRCEFTSDTAGDGVAVEMSKAFDGTITRSLFTNYAVAVDLHGCDLTSITDVNRFVGSSTAAIRLTSYGTFGSHTMISGNDFLLAASGVYILSSQHDLRVRDNYFESPVDPLDAVIRSTAGRALHLTDNRVEVPAAIAPTWLDVQHHTVLCDVRGNTTAGAAYGPATFPTGGSRYFYNVNHRQRITHAGNSNPDGFPFNSAEAAPAAPQAAFVWTPDLPGLTSSDYGAAATVVDGALVVPAIASYGSLITIETGVTGSIAIGVVARGATDGQTLSYQRLNGGVAQEGGTLTLTTTDAYYPLFYQGGLPVADLSLKFWNDTGGDAYLRTVTVRWT